MTVNSALTEARLQSPTGADLKLYSRLADGTARAVVHIQHGLAEHAKRYGLFASELTAQGYHVYAHDHRGHGATTAGDAPLGAFAASEGWPKVIADIDAVHGHIRAQHPQLPIILFGHSMGSIVGLSYVLRHPTAVAGAALWNAGFDAGGLAAVGKVLLSAEKLFLGRGGTSWLAPKLTFEAWNKELKPNRTGFDWLSKDEDQVDAYVADPLCGFGSSVGMMLDVIEGVFYGADDKHFADLDRHLPFHLVGGSMDPSTKQGVEVSKFAGRLAAMGFDHVDCTIFDGMRHESLNETDRQLAVQSFLQWCDKVVGRT